jgi:hypothetical protein
MPAMFALNEIYKFEGEKEKIKILKPLWNVITDYLLVFLAVMSIVFGGMQITSGSFHCLAAVDCPGISRSNVSSSLLSQVKYRNACKAFYSSQKTNIIKRTDVVTDLKSSLYYTNFVNSECSKSAIPDFLVYFWFAIFIQAFVLIVLNNLWLKLPNTASVIEDFVSLVIECYASPFPNFVSTQTRVDQQPDSTNSETPRLVPDNNGNQPHEFDNSSQNPSRRRADGQQPHRSDIEMATLLPDSNACNQPHDNISQNPSRRHADDQPRDTDATEMPASDNDGNQPYNFNILEDPATISAVKTLYEKVHTFKENVESSQKIWRLYLLQTILQASFAIAFFVFDIYFMKDLKGTMTCTLTQHIPVAHDYFICSHNLAPTYVWGLKVVYLPTLASALAIFIFTIVWTFNRRGKNKFKYDFKNKRLPSPVASMMTDTFPVDKDFGFLLHLLHSYNKLYVVRFAHFLSEKNKKKFQIFQARRSYALKEQRLLMQEMMSSSLKISEFLV